MANHLKMADVQLIRALRERGWSFRRIGRELGIHRDTARRYCVLAESGENRPNPLAESDGQNRPNPPAGSEGQNRPNPPTGSSGPPSTCEPFRQVIEAALGRGLSSQRIWQDLRSDHGFAGGYDSVKRFVRWLIPVAELPFRRMECEPGAEAQVDFGTGAPVVIPEGQPLPVGVKSRRRKSHVFRIVLSHSRKAYSEAVFRQTTEDFIRALENALWHFGGVPKTLVIDNLKAAVKKTDWFDPQLNPKIQSFCQHYGTVILPTKPRTPRHKGKVERQVGYVQDNGLKGRTFASLADENSHLLEWETQVADNRIHGTTRQQVRKTFEEVEKPALLPLPISRFPFFQEGLRKANRDGHIEVAKAYYSVPPEYLGREVWARWDGRTVRIFNSRFEQIAIHVKHEPGRFSTQDSHIDPKKRSGIERGATWLLNKAALLGPHTQHWAEQMIQLRGIEGVRVLQGLLSLAGRHPCRSIERACEAASRHGAYRLHTIRQLIQRQGDRQEQFEFIDEHPIIRPMAEYAAIVHRSFGLGETGSAGFPEPLPGASFPSGEKDSCISISREGA